LLSAKTLSVRAVMPASPNRTLKRPLLTTRDTGVPGSPLAVPSLAQ
jgi:hypothetical protein